MRPPRPDFDWTRLNDGEMPLEELQRIDVTVSRPVDEYGGEAGDQVATGYNGLGLIPAGLRSLWVRLTSLYTAEGPLALYNFTQVVFEDNDPVDVEGGISSVALETSGNDGLLTSDVDPDGVGTIVQVWLGEDSLNGCEGEKWRFSCESGGTSTTNNYTDTTFNYYGTNVTNVYETWNWTIYDGGTWYVGGPGYIIFEAPFKIYGGLWLNYRTHDFSGASQVDDLGIDTDDPQRVVLRITLDQDCLLTGLVPTADSGSGQVVGIVNTDPTFTLTLGSMNFASTGGNRIGCPGFVDLDLTPGSAAMLWYDVVSVHWRVIGFCCGTTTGGGGGGPLGPGGASVQWLHQPNRWYYGGHPPDVLTSSFATLSTSIVYAFPFLSGAGGVVDDIGIEIGSAISGESVHLGIYSNKAEDDLRPDAKLYDSGVLSTAGSVYIRVGGGVNITFDPDTLYWLVMQCSSASIHPRAASANDAWPILGSDPASPGGPQAIGWTTIQAYGTLPSSWPTGASTAVYVPNNSTGLFLIGVLFDPVNTGGTGGGGGGPIDGTTPTTLTGILQGDGSVVGTVTVGSGLTYSGGTLSASGGAGTGSVTSVGTGTGLTGGPITTSGTVALANTTVSPGSYGDSTHVATFTVDAQGRLTGAGTALLSAGGTGTVTSLGYAAPAAGLTITGTNPTTTTGTWTFALADDLAALEALSGTNTIYYRSGASTWSAVTFSGLTFSGGVLTVPGGAVGSVTDTATVDLTLTGTALSADVKNASITNAMLANVATATFKGRTTAGTGAPEDLTAAAAAALLPAFVAAGASHAKGIVPDPGATAQPNYPDFLGRDAAWHPIVGFLLGVSTIATQQSTSTLNTWVDLSTIQTVSFTLDATTTVMIQATAAYVNTGSATAVGELAASIDSAAPVAILAQARPVDTTNAACLAGAQLATLAAGSHTVTLKFLTNGGTAFFSGRTITVTRIS